MNREEHIPTPLRALIVEDSENDVMLLLSLLKQGGYEVSHEWVHTAGATRAALASHGWDIVFSDFGMPGFDGRAALKLVREHDPDLPFILVSGSIGENTAVDIMKAGASNYVMKGNSVRLIPAVQRELHDSELRHERKRAREALRVSEAGLSRAQLVAKLAHVVTGPQGEFETWSETLPVLLGLDRDRMPRSTRAWLDLLDPGDREMMREKSIAASRTGKSVDLDYRLKRGDGVWVDLHQVIEPIASDDGNAGGTHWFNTLQDVTEAKRALNALQESEARFRSLTALSSDWYWEQDEEYRFVDQGADAYTKQYIQPAVTTGKRRWDNATANLSAEQWAAHRAVLDARQPFHDLEYSRLGTDGERHWVSVSGEPVFDVDGKFTGYRGVGKDVTEKKLIELRINRLNRVYAVLSGINTLIVRVRDREELFAGACRIAVEEGKFPRAWIGVYDSRKEHVTLAAFAGGHARFFDEVIAQINERGLAGTSIATRAIATALPVVVNDIQQDQGVLNKAHAVSTGSRAIAALPLILAGEVKGILVLHAGDAGFFDAPEMRLLTELAGDIAFALDHLGNQERLSYLAYYDALTGLANRTLFVERIEQYLADARFSGHTLALKLMNIDGFKGVNDTLGREAGDDLLRQITSRMLAASKEPARLARIGGDTFGMIALNPAGAEETARLIEHRNEQVFGTPFMLGSAETRIAATFGIAMFPEDGADAETLIKNAEVALKNAKAKGERYLFYTQEMTRRVAERLSLENKLRQALEREEFVLHYQPKVELRTRTIVGVEALIRWKSPELGLVPPLKFIPLLEDTGLIVEVGAWALRRAVLDHAGWAHQAIQAPRVAVNVSPVQLRRPDFVAGLESAIREGASPHGLDLEITESLIMQDVEGSIGKLKAARDLGISIAIDDFGTGYSSLAYLARLPVQMLKIDRAFIIKMLDDPNVMTLVRIMISLAHSLRLKVVAEGVEEEEQARMLHLLRCDEMQGYLFSKPLPLQEITALLKAAGQPRPASA